MSEKRPVRETKGMVNLEREEREREKR